MSWILLFVCVLCALHTASSSGMCPDGVRDGDSTSGDFSRLTPSSAFERPRWTPGRDGTAFRPSPPKGSPRPSEELTPRELAKHTESSPIKGSLAPEEEPALALELDDELANLLRGILLEKSDTLPRKRSRA